MYRNMRNCKRSMTKSSTHIKLMSRTKERVRNNHFQPVNNRFIFGKAATSRCQRKVSDSFRQVTNKVPDKRLLPSLELNLINWKIRYKRSSVSHTTDEAGAPDGVRSKTDARSLYESSTPLMLRWATCSRRRVPRFISNKSRNWKQTTEVIRGRLIQLIRMHTFWRQ